MWFSANGERVYSYNAIQKAMNNLEKAGLVEMNNYGKQIGTRWVIVTDPVEIVRKKNAQKI